MRRSADIPGMVREPLGERTQWLPDGGIEIQVYRGKAWKPGQEDWSVVRIGSSLKALDETCTAFVRRIARLLDTSVTLRAYIIRTTTDALFARTSKAVNDPHPVGKTPLLISSGRSRCGPAAGAQAVAFHGLTPDTVAKDVLKILQDAGVDTSLSANKAHSTRGVGASALVAQSAALDAVCNMVGWASPKTFLKWYKRAMPPGTTMPALKPSGQTSGIVDCSKFSGMLRAPFLASLGLGEQAPCSVPAAQVEPSGQVVIPSLGLAASMRSAHSGAQ